MISLRGLAVFTLAALIATITAALTLAADGSWPAALLAAGAAGGTTLSLLLRLLGDDDGNHPSRPD